MIAQHWVRRLFRGTRVRQSARWFEVLGSRLIGFGSIVGFEMRREGFGWGALQEKSYVSLDSKHLTDCKVTRR